MSLLLAIFWPYVLWASLLLFIVFLVNEINFLRETRRIDPALIAFAPILLYLRGITAAAGAGIKIGKMLVAKKGRQGS